MTIVISFKTAKFDTRKERPNPINPIAGESVLFWLRDEVLSPAYSCTDPDCEDWGWYMNVTNRDDRYMVGAIAFDEDRIDADTVIEWLIQIHKHQSLKDKILGRGKTASDDPLVEKIFGSLVNEESFHEVEWE